MMYTTALEECPACGYYHAPLTFTPMQHPRQTNEGAWSHAAVCPDTGVRLYMRFGPNSTTEFTR